MKESIIKFGLSTIGLCSILIIQSCNSPNSIAENHKLIHDFDTISKTYKMDFTANYTGGIDVLTFDVMNLVAYNYCGDNTVKIINHFNDSAYVLPQYNPSCKKVYTRLLENDFYVIGTNNKINIYYENNSEIEEFDLMEIETFKNSGLTVEWYKPGGDQHVNIPKNTLYFRVNQNYYDSLGIYSDYDVEFPAFAKLNIQTKEINFFGKTPYFSIYGEYGFNSNYFDLYVGDSIITSTPINGKIEVINTLDGTVTTKNVKSKFDTTSINKIHYSENGGNANEIKSKHTLLSANYESLFYNPWTGFYYRIFHPAMNEYNENDEPNTEFDKKSILMIMNKDLDLIDEFEIPVHRKKILKLYPTKNGVTISLPELVEMNKENVTFKFLEISHFFK